MCNSHVVRCFRRRCRLPVKVSDGLIFNGVVFCSQKCKEEWEKESAEEVHIPVHQGFRPPIQPPFKTFRGVEVVAWQHPIKVHD